MCVCVRVDCPVCLGTTHKRGKQTQARDRDGGWLTWGMGVGTLRLSRGAHFFFFFISHSRACCSCHGLVLDDHGTAGCLPEGAGEGGGFVSLVSCCFLFSLDNSISPTGPNLDAAATLRRR